MVGQAEGLWTLGSNLDATLLAAHHALVRAKLSGVAPAFAGRDRRFLVPVDPGVFVCSVLTGKDISFGYELEAHVHAHTWLHGDQLHDDQRRRLRRLSPMEMPASALDTSS